MVSYYNPAAMAMFSRTGSAHHHHPHHHSSPPQNHYFAPAYSSYHPHHHHHHQTAPPTPVGVGVGGAAAQFSPNMPTDFNCNHQYHHQFGNMTPDSMAAATSWPQQMYGACAAARNIVHPAAAGYEEWGHQHSHVPPTSASTHPSFYPHQQPSPHNSTPSPSSPHTAGHHSPNVYNSATSNHSQSFKIEFGPCSGGNPQENSSQEMQTQGPVVSSAGATISIGTPHSPDSGMAISDGVSSSGSPATGQAQNSQQQQHQQQQQQQQQHCLNVASHHHLSSTVPNLNGAILQGSQATNLNNLSQQQSLHTGRPAQARSPYEWMKKPSYSTGSNPGGECRKTRTKDKYRVVYSDTQRLELEKEFHYSRYITIRRKAELASILGLSERQVKIWFQNRRAKERKVVRKREEAMHRDKIASIVQMQNIAVAAAGGMATVSGGPMCNQPNGNPVSLPQLM